jgi:uroporphyrinogen-III synthase
MPDTLIVTRPLAQAGELAQRLRQAGRDVVVFPLLDIQPLPDATALRAVLARLTDFALVAFVSPNAIDATFAQLAAWPVTVPLAVMGEGSRRALARHGVHAPEYQISSPHDTERTDSQTLLQALDLERLRGRRVLILRGESGRELLADALRAAGVEVEQVAAYRRSVVPLDAGRAQQLGALLAAPHGWIITSSQALQGLLESAARVDPQQGVAKLQLQHFYVPHRRIAETALACGLQHIHLTNAGDDGLLTALQSRP